MCLGFHSTRHSQQCSGPAQRGGTAHMWADVPPTAPALPTLHLTAAPPALCQNHRRGSAVILQIPSVSDFCHFWQKKIQFSRIILFFHSAKQFKVPHPGMQFVLYIILSGKTYGSYDLVYIERPQLPIKVYSSVGNQKGFLELSCDSHILPETSPHVWIEHHKNLHCLQRS